MNIDEIKEAINNAVNCKSKLTDRQLMVGGFTSVKIRHLLNNMGSISKGYLEIGSHIGCSLISACYGNDSLESIIACDNFSEFDGVLSKEKFFINADRELNGRYTLLEKDCFLLTAHDIPPGVDFYLYDGSHDYNSQYNGITKIFDLLADEFILCVDDISWQNGMLATINGLKEMTNYRIEYLQFLWDGKSGNSNEWWNGIMIALIKRQL